MDNATDAADTKHRRNLFNGCPNSVRSKKPNGMPKRWVKDCLVPRPWNQPFQGRTRIHNLLGDGIMNS
jgi:hypothetical protein